MSNNSEIELTSEEREHLLERRKTKTADEADEVRLNRLGRTPARDWKPEDIAFMRSDAAKKLYRNLGWNL